MDSCAELRAFYDWALINRPSTGQIALWNALYQLFARSGRSEWFSVPNLTLQLLTGLSEDGVSTARNQLMQKGLIVYEKGGPRRPGRYKMAAFIPQNFGLSVRESVGVLAGESVRESAGVTEQPEVIPQNFGLSVRESAGVLAGESVGESDLLRVSSRSFKALRDQEQEQEIKRHDNDVVDHAHAHEREQIRFCFRDIYGQEPNREQLNQLMSFVDQGCEWQLVRWALSEARMRDKPPVYARSILQGAVRAGVFTAAEAEKREAERQAAASKGSYEVDKPDELRGQRDDRYSAFYDLYPDT